MKLSRLALLSLFALTSSPVWADGIVTVYSADGLHDGDNSWYQHQFAAFTKATGIKVQYVEGGSGAIVERLAKERTNPQADVLVTVPPFIQRAAKEQLLAEFQPQDSARIPGVHDRYSPLVVARRFFLHEKSKKIAQIKPVQLHCAKLIAKRLKVRKETFHFISAQRCRPVDHLPYMTVKVIRCPHIRATNAQA